MHFVLNHQLTRSHSRKSDEINCAMKTVNEKLSSVTKEVIQSEHKQAKDKLQAAFVLKEQNLVELCVQRDKILKVVKGAIEALPDSSSGVSLRQTAEWFLDRRVVNAFNPQYAGTASLFPSTKQKAEGAGGGLIESRPPEHKKQWTDIQENYDKLLDIEREIKDINWEIKNKEHFLSLETNIANEVKFTEYQSKLLGKTR